MGEYYVCNEEVFLLRGESSSFENKWHGLWKADFKFLDGWVYEVNGVKFNGSEFKYDYFEAAHFSRVNSFLVQENVFTPLKGGSVVSVLTVKNVSNKRERLVVKLFLRVNMRSYSENKVDKVYDVVFRKGSVVNYLMVSNGGDCVLVGCFSGETSFSEGGVFVDYVSDGAPQKFFRPGVYEVVVDLRAGESVELPFVFSVSKNGLTSDFLVGFVDLGENWRREYDVVKKDWVEWRKRFLHEPVNPVLRAAADSVRLLFFDGKVLTGLPWFSQFWARDLFWSLKGLLCLGEFKRAKNILKLFSERVLAGGDLPKGTVPKMVTVSGEAFYDSVDATPLFVIALRDYLNYTGDFVFLTELKGLLFDFVKWFEKVERNGKLLNYFSGEKLTWMDTLNRVGGVEVEALHCEALRALGDLFKFLGEEFQTFYDAAEKVRVGLEEYWVKGFYKDALNRDELTPNQLFLLLFDLVPVSRVKRVVKKLLTKQLFSSRGLRSLSSASKSFGSGKYHEGCVWGFLNAFFLHVLFKHGFYDEGVELLRVVERNVWEHGLGCFSEVFCNDEPSGCSNQLWSAAPLLSVFDEGLIGFEPKLLEGKVVVRKPLAPVKRFDKRVGEVLVDLEFSGGSVELFFNKQPSFKVEFEGELFTPGLNWSSR